ncbi:GTP-binding protein 10 homolog isoform X1 [Osmia bicornis bicornis]|uniref:GTP-binding protein 10 homolog isoform X1 n=1 Tax=Osmia bicornis bicornis TaxID=1437191 RepID=UPI0010F797B6|nr:GTP-binding protein 10 homolog isoform X1 [Osmia bicornis bicornis]
MVLLTRVLGYSSKLPRKYKRTGFIDSLRIYVAAGSGGSGLHRYGGLGGAGGNVCVVAKEGLTLRSVKNKIENVKLKAESGGESTKNGIIGTPGKDLTITIPTGVTVYDDSRIKLGELNSENETLIVAKGGLGGSENTGYCGLKGERRGIILDLKLIADVGLIGFPNAGKSTLLNAISKAKPKIADYPFTTIKPQIGIIKYNDYRQISVADLPGLIEGAHVNKGMGFNFLKHIERTKLLLFVIDIQGFQISVKHQYRSCLETILLLNKEIELYKPDLLDKPAMIVINKMDTEGANEIYKDIEPKLSNLSEASLKFDEAMQPKKFLQFDDILPTALIKKDADDVQRIKEKIRHIIDKYEETKASDQSNESNEDRLYEKLKRQINRHAPTLI